MHELSTTETSSKTVMQQLLKEWANVVCCICITASWKLSTSQMLRAWSAFCFIGGQWHPFSQVILCSYAKFGQFLFKAGGNCILVWPLVLFMLMSTIYLKTIWKRGRGLRQRQQYHIYVGWRRYTVGQITAQHSSSLTYVRSAHASGRCFSGRLGCLWFKLLWIKIDSSRGFNVRLLLRPSLRNGTNIANS